MGHGHTHVQSSCITPRREWELRTFFSGNLKAGQGSGPCTGHSEQCLCFCSSNAHPDPRSSCRAAAARGFSRYVYVDGLWRVPFSCVTWPFGPVGSRTAACVFINGGVWRCACVVVWEARARAPEGECQFSGSSLVLRMGQCHKQRPTSGALGPLGPTAAQQQRRPWSCN